MRFYIRGLSPQKFEHLFPLTDAELALRSVIRYRADRNPGFPCRVSLADAEPGDEVLLVNYEHQPAHASPHKANGPLFVRAARSAFDAVDATPPVLRSRLLSVRGYDRADLIAAAEVAQGDQIEDVIGRYFQRADVAYLHLHYASRGCFAMRVDRA